METPGFFFYTAYQLGNIRALLYGIMEFKNKYIFWSTYNISRARPESYSVWWVCIHIYIFKGEATHLAVEPQRLYRKWLCSAAYFIILISEHWCK